MFNAWHTWDELTVDLIDDGVIESGKAFAIQLFDAPHEGLVAPPEAVAVEILDDDTPVESPTIAMPLQLGNRWTFDATTSWQRGFEEPLVGHGTRVASLDERVHFRGDDYLCLSLSSPSSSASGLILLRQSGDYWTALDRRTLHVFGRENTVVPAGQFCQTLQVRYEQEYEYSGVTMGFSSSVEFTLADSVGFVRVDTGSYQYGQTDPVWQSCDAELASYFLGE